MITIGYKTKFDSIIRAVAAIGIGLVLVFGSNAPTVVVKIISVFLMVAGVVSLVYGLIKNKENGMYQVLIINAVLDILLGLLLFFNPQWVASFIVLIIGIVLILFGALQLLVLASTMSLLGAGFSSLILSICAIVGGAFLMFNPFSVKVMSIIAGFFLVLYGVSELISTWKVVKARKEYEIQRGPATPAQEAPVPGQIDASGIDDAREVDFERIDDPDDLDDMN
ncbi:MAG: DUF308 domain-containing protein [Bacteroidales bacterium]|nr:DUF308 domain-containing protein [Bacteroidales bacterium]